MLKVIFVLSSVVILSSCASSDFLSRLERGFSRSDVPSQETIDFYKDALDECFRDYISCMQSESDALVPSKSTAYEIADAAQAICSRKIDAYEAAFRKYMIVSNENHYSQHAENLVQAHIRNLEKGVKGKVVYKVVNSRK